MTDKIPERGDDGLYRLDCPRCGKLQFRFARGLRGGPVERKCDRRECRNTFQVWFNEVPDNIVFGSSG